MGADTDVVVMNDVGRRSDGSFQGADRGEFGNCRERGEVSEDIQVVQHPIGKNMFESRVEKDNTKEGVIQKHGEGIAGTIFGIANARRMLRAAELEDVQIVHDSWSAAGHDVLQ